MLLTLAIEWNHGEHLLRKTLIFFCRVAIVEQEVPAQTSKAKSDAEILNMSKLAVFDDSDKDVEDFTLSDQCDYYMPKIKKKKYEKKLESSNDDMSMPKRYCHIRSGERNVCEEIYSAMHLLSSKYHMSKQQIE